MADSQKEKKKMRKHTKEFLVFLFLAILYLVILFYRYYISQQQGSASSDLVIVPAESSSQSVETFDGKVLKMHIINCGQGDSFLFEYDKQYAMIDCGPQPGKEERVVNYLKRENVDKISFIVGTHHHDDHMGGMANILDNFSCDTVYMPKFSTDTNWYTKILSRIKKYHVKRVNPKVGDTYYLGDVSFNVIGQLTTKEANGNTNNMSTVIKVTYGNMDIIMTGDAEKDFEKKIIESGINLDAEVLKLGHHGSDTSTSDKFLDAVNPTYAIISCGLDNRYGHPCKSTMDKLGKRNIQVYRTDQMGDIIMTVTPNSISFDKQKGDYRCGIISNNLERMVQDD